MVVPRSHHQLVASNSPDEILALGGVAQDGTCTNIIEAYNKVE